MPKKYHCNKKTNDLFTVLSEASGIMSNTLVNLENVINLNSMQKNTFVFIQLNTDKYDPFDFNKIEELIEIGRKSAKKNLKKLIEISKS